ncbi:MAG: hypothetical protein MRY83_24540 [Flavobacteriales bacterium]|nr:hypothetical protein [Flavobacteriales bacterium]
MKRKIIQGCLSILLCTVISAASGQGLFKGNYWKQFRKEIVGGVGASNFLGELGGKDQVGTDFLQDFEFLATRYVVQGGFRYYIFRSLSAKGAVHYGRLYGNDNLTSEPFRRNRNLHFRSDIVELSVQGEYHILEERTGTKYKIRGMKGGRSFIVGLYGFVGVGGYYNNAKGEYLDGKWYSLQPLGTEGQGLEGRASKYKRVGISFPMGLGLRYSINTQWKIGLEVGWRKTFDDYLDDVSGTYYFQDEIREANGDVAAYFADPNLGEQLLGGPNLCQTCAGEPRGDANDFDSYMFATVNAYYKLYKRRGFRRIKSRRSVPSF